MIEDDIGTEKAVRSVDSYGSSNKSNHHFRIFDPIRA